MEGQEATFSHMIERFPSSSKEIETVTMMAMLTEKILGSENLQSNCVQFKAVEPSMEGIRIVQKDLVALVVVLFILQNVRLRHVCIFVRIRNVVRGDIL
jgi:hypothetical protein